MEVIRLPLRKKNKSRVYCAVNGCSSKSHVNLEISFHAIPKPGISFVTVEDEFGKLEKIDRMKAWQRILKIKNVNPHMRVCSLHFERCDFLLPNVISKKMTLKKTCVPSCNLPSSEALEKAKNSKQVRHPHQMNHSLKKEVIENHEILYEDCGFVNLIDKIVPDKSDEDDNAVEIPLEKYSDFKEEMQKDTTNYIKYKMGFSKKILLADGAKPSKFHCQEDAIKRLAEAGSSRQVCLKKQRVDRVGKCLQSRSVAEPHGESLQNDDIKQEIIEPEELPKTQDQETITDPIMTEEKSIQVTTNVDMYYKGMAVQTSCQNKSISTSPIKFSATSEGNLESL